MSLVTHSLLSGFLVLLCSAAYSVSMTRVVQGPLISHQNSPYDYNYNSGYLPLVGKNLPGEPPVDCLVVRVQNMVGGVPVPSEIAIFCEDGNHTAFSREPYVVLEPSQSPWQVNGCEDPRVQLIPNQSTLLMFYTGVNFINCQNGDERATLQLASCNVTQDPKCKKWTLHGPVFPNTFWSKSAALLVHDGATSTDHYLLWGDSNIALATTSNFFNYTDTGLGVICTRSGMFDSALVESGPPPMRLSDGNYLFLYNSAQQVNIPNPKPGWNLQYNLGYAILNISSGQEMESCSGNGKLPFNIVQRSEQPIFSPLMGWEQCNDANPVEGLTPNVVFVNGAKPLEGGAPNQFVVFYQGCDARTGVALLTVSGSA